MEEDRPTSSVSLRAEELVTAVLERAHRAVTSDPDPDRPAAAVTATQEDHPAAPTVDWASCEDFSVELGRTQITEYIGTWALSPRWLLHLVYLGTTEEEHHHTLHRYRARWSLPTRRSPVPRDTASVYFTVRLSGLRPPRTERVEVCYTLESSQLVHHAAAAGGTRFWEGWLEDVVRSKALLRRAVDF